VAGIAPAIYVAGGASGALLPWSIDVHTIARMRIPIKGHSRISTAIFEKGCHAWRELRSDCSERPLHLPAFSASVSDAGDSTDTEHALERVSF